MLKISVIVAAYNKEKYIGACLESIFNQTLLPHQVIVMDDGSTDDTLSVIQQFAQKYPIEWTTRPNRGQIITLNEGIAQSRHELIAFLDADDYWALDKLEKQQAVLQNHPTFDACSGMIQQFVSEGLDPNRFVFDPKPQKGLLRAAFLWRKSFLGQVGAIDETLRVADFIEWYGRAQAYGIKAHFLEQIVLYRRLSPNTLSQQSGYQKTLLGILKNRIIKK